MKVSTACAWASLFTSTTFAAASASQNNKFVKLSFDKSIGTKYDQSSKTNPFQKRDGSGYTSIDLSNQQTFYSVKLSIGTPAQEVTVLVDTGSSDLWIMGSDNSFCTSNSKSNSDKHRELGEGEKKDVYKTIAITLSPDDIASYSNNDDGDDPFAWITNILPQGGGFGGATQTVTLGSGGNGGSIPTGTASGAEATIDCSKYGTFDKEDSSSFKSNDTSFAISYGDDSYASGVWGTDTLHVGSVDVKDVSMAVSNFTNSTIGVLGIGLPGLETTYSGGLTTLGAKSYQYANFPMVLKDNGIIEQIAYSLYLDDPDASTGSVLFGALDHSKYSGGLYTVPLVNVYESQGINKPVEFDITLYGIGYQSADENVTIAQTSIPALLDSGTTISYFPPQLLELIATQLGATYNDYQGYYLMDCVSDDDTTEIVFDFGGFHITVPLADFQSQVSPSQCMLMMSTQAERIILGDVFLQHAYVVYDLENLEISMGQANFDSNDDEDIELISGTTVPSATQAPSYSSPWVSTNMVSTGGDIFTVGASVATAVRGNNTIASGSSRVTTLSSGARATSSTSASDQKKQNMADVTYPVHSITTYLFILLVTYFI